MSSTLVHPLRYLLLLLFGVVVLFLRNMDPLIQPAMYTEDGAWLGMAMSKGWMYTFQNAKSGYFVFGNLLFLWLSSFSSLAFCNDKLICLPQSLAIWSYIFFAGTATLSVYATRKILPLKIRFLIFFLIILIPLGNSANEIIGRISNIGYFAVFWSVLLVYTKAVGSGSWTVIIGTAVGLIVTAATNPVCYILIPILAIFSTWINGAKEAKDLIRKLAGQYGYIFIGLLILLILQLYTFSGHPGTRITGKINVDHLIEVGITRSLLYPFVFAIYQHLNDQYSIFILSAFVGLITYLSWKIRHNTEVIHLLGLSLISLLIFLAATLYMRQSLTQQLGGYQTTFPDRYFMGLNVIFTFSLVVLAASNINIGKFASALCLSFLISIILVYITSINWILELNKPRLNIAIHGTFSELICKTPPSYGENIVTNTTLLPIYFSGWTMEIPNEQLKASREKLKCGNP